MKFFISLITVSTIICTSTVYAWTGDTWGPISRETITSIAGEMMDSTWTPLYNITNFDGSSGKSYYSGTTYTGELYTNSNRQDWAEFFDSVSTTTGGNTYYGNNCARFVNISWKLPKFYSIPAINDNLNGTNFYALGDFGEGPYVSLLPGDAFYTSGHTFLFGKYNPDGTIESMEQVPPAARRRTWSWSALTNFRPIRRNLIIGGTAITDRIQTSYDLSVRSCSSVNCEQIWTAPMAAQGTVVEGPQNADGYRWWKVQYDDYETSGWSTEGHLKKMITQTLTCGSSSDSTPPTGFLTINAGASYAGVRSVMLNLSCADDESGCAWMQFSHDGTTWTPWEPYTTSKNWILPSGDGEKTVYVQFKDACANVSIPYSSSIIFQTTTPDFIISSLIVPAASGSEMPILITDTTSNIGSGGANASTTSFFFSSNTSLDTGDILLGNRSVLALETGVSSTETTSLIIPSGLSPGTYYIIAKANSMTVVGDCGYITPCGSIVETNTNNNTRKTSIKIGPDLIVSSLTAPAKASAGAVISVTDTTKNSGGVVAEANTTSLYLSTDTFLGTGDVFLGNRPVSGLEAGQSSKVTTFVIIPSGLSPGIYYIIVKADDLNAVIEANEANNTKYKVISIGL